MLYDDVAAFANAVAALEEDPGNDRLRCVVCQQSRVTCYAAVMALLFYRGLMTEGLTETVRSLFRRALEALGGIDDVYAGNVAARQEALEGAIRSAQQRQQEDEELLARVARKYLVDLRVPVRGSPASP